MHWCAWLKPGSQKCYFDSFGQRPPNEMVCYLKSVQEYKSKKCVIQLTTVTQYKKILYKNAEGYVYTGYIK